MRSNDNVVLDAKGIRKKFGQLIAVDNVNLHVMTGEVVGIIGTNGAGKTTFLNVITGYIAADSGSVQLGGMDITRLSPARIARAGIGRSFQIPQIFERWTICENLLCAAVIANGGRYRGHWVRPRARMEARCREVATLLGFADELGKMPREIAGGTRKLVDIAMALIGEPRLLLLDEPTSGVSEQEKSFLLERVLVGMRALNVATLLIEHDMEIIRKFTERVYAFIDGAIASEGTVSEVFDNPRVQSEILA